jgi:hypothetical protein
MGVTELLAAILGAIVGSALGGYISFVSQTRAVARSERVQRTLRLYEEWQGTPMLTVRTRASWILQQNLTTGSPKSFSQLARSLLDAEKEDDWTAVSRVVHFFEMVTKLLDEGEIHSPMFWRLFGRYVDYWHDTALDQLIEISEREDTAIEAGWSSAIRRLRNAGLSPTARHAGHNDSTAGGSLEVGSGCVVVAAYD